MTTTTCLYKGCAEVVDDGDVACPPHLIFLQLIGYGVSPAEAHRLAELEGQPVTVTAVELLEDVDGGALGVETTTLTGVHTVVPALYARRYRKKGKP